MNEVVYIVSNDLVLIKQVIDYSLISSTFSLKGISTGGYIKADTLVENNISVLIIDEGCMSQSLLNCLHEQMKHPICENIALLHMCDGLMGNVRDVFSGFKVYKQLWKKRGIFELLHSLETIYNDGIDQESTQEQMISEYLYSLHIKPKVFGFLYLKTAIAMCIETPQMKLDVICDQIARMFRVTSTRVDRCMRTSIENAYHNHTETYEGFDFEKKPTSKHLISRIAAEIAYTT